MFSNPVLSEVVSAQTVGWVGGIWPGPALPVIREGTFNSRVK